MTKTGTKMGTIFYMSPEQIKAVKDIDNRTDIYSLGVTFYEMLSGKVPFNVDTDSDFEIMNEIVSGEIKDPREIYPHISDWVVDVLFSSVEKDRDKRIQSTDDFTKRLLAREGKKAATGTADKTMIDQSVKEPAVTPKTTVVSPPVPESSAPPPFKKEVVPPSVQDRSVKRKSSGGKKFIYGGIGLVAAVLIIYFVVFNNPESGPVNPDDPSITTDTETMPNNYEEKFLQGTSNDKEKIKEPDKESQVKTKRQYGRGMAGRTSKPTAARR